MRYIILITSIFLLSCHEAKELTSQEIATKVSECDKLNLKAAVTLYAPGGGAVLIKCYPT